MTQFDAGLCKPGDKAPFGIWPPFGEVRCGAKPDKGHGSCSRPEHRGQHVAIAGWPPNHLKVVRTWWGHPECADCGHPEAKHRQAGPTTWVCDGQLTSRACNCGGYRA